MIDYRPQQIQNQQPTQSRPSVAVNLPKPPSQQAVEAEAEPIGLVAEEAGAAAPVSKIRSYDAGAQSLRKQGFTRPTVTTGQGACRVRSFHGKLSIQGLEFMDNQINEWLDTHPDVEVKFVTSSVGTFEGKIREPAVILNLWY